MQPDLTNLDSTHTKFVIVCLKKKHSEIESLWKAVLRKLMR